MGELVSVLTPLLFMFATASCCLLKKINLVEEFMVYNVFILLQQVQVISFHEISMPSYWKLNCYTIIIFVVKKDEMMQQLQNFNFARNDSN